MNELLKGLLKFLSLVVGIFAVMFFFLAVPGFLGLKTIMMIFIIMLPIIILNLGSTNRNNGEIVICIILTQH